jgi:hypothetical protein
MSSSVAKKLDAVHPQMLRAGSEPDRKKLADLGQSVERALELWGKSKQETAYALGYSDPGTVSRWCSGTERPHMEKLLALDGFEEAWIKARAEKNRRVIVRTVIEILDKVG